MSSADALADVTLAGRYVRLEPIALAHVSGLLAAADARETYVFTAVPADEPSMRAYVDDALSQRAAGRAVPFAVVRVADGRVVGVTCLCNLEYWTWPDGARRRPRVDPPDAVEIGWTWLSAGAQRTKINTEAKLLLLAHAFETWGVCRVSLKTDARNLRSRAAIERLGARLDGLLRAHQPRFDGGGARTSAWYSILAEEWPDVRAGLDARLARGVAY